MCVRVCVCMCAWGGGCAELEIARGVGIDPAGPVLARPLFLKIKIKFHFTEVLV